MFENFITIFQCIAVAFVSVYLINKFFHALEEIFIHN